MLLEAMAHGVPVVGLQCGGPGYLMDDGAGAAVPVGKRRETVNRLADELQRLGTDATHKGKLREAERNKVKDIQWNVMRYGIIMMIN